MQSDEPTTGADGTLGRIALKQVRVSRAEVEARNREATVARKAGNPMNRLVPYLDLFWRLGDEELSRLARAPSSAVESLRQQIEEVNRALGRYIDLLPRLSDDELARLTGATTKTIRFWRLSQPRHLQGEGRRPATAEPADRREPSSAQSSGAMPQTEELRHSEDELSETSSSSGPYRASEQSSELDEPTIALARQPSGQLPAPGAD